MTLQTVLNADMKTVGPWLAAGWHWWVRELHDMLPKRLQHYLRHHSQFVAVLRPDGSFILMQHGKEKDAPATGQLPVTLVLSEHQFLMRDIELPKLSAKDLRALIVFEMDRLTPFQPADVLSDMALIAGAAQPGHQRVRLLAVPRTTAEQAIESARKRGLIPTALTRWMSDSADPRFNLLKHDTATLRTEISARQFWWLAAAALLIVNLTVAILRDVRETQQLREQVDIQAPVARAAQVLQRRVTAEHQRRAERVATWQLQDPLQILSSLSAHLPASVWVQKFIMTGDVVQINGYAAPLVDVKTILRRSPLVHSIETMTTNSPSTDGTAIPFDIRITLRHKVQS